MTVHTTDALAFVGAGSGVSALIRETIIGFPVSLMIAEMAIASATGRQLTWCEQPCERWL